MPYKDMDRKKEWEQQHRSERLARRRQLRQIEEVRMAAQPEALSGHDGAPSILLPLVAGGALAAYNPKLAMGQVECRVIKECSSKAGSVTFHRETQFLRA
jgi:hypothetical protein